MFHEIQRSKGWMAERCYLLAAWAWARFVSENVKKQRVGEFGPVDHLQEAGTTPALLLELYTDCFTLKNQFCGRYGGVMSSTRNVSTHRINRRNRINISIYPVSSINYDPAGLPPLSLAFISGGSGGNGFPSL